MVFFAVVATENVQFIFEKRGSMIFDLWRLDYLTTSYFLWLIIVTTVHLLLFFSKTLKKSLQATSLGLLLGCWLFSVFGYENPFQLLGLLLAGQ